MPRILVVDDDCTSHLILKKMVEGMGYDCDVASNGQEAVDAAEKNYMAILMDIFMPVLNGCEAAVSIAEIGQSNRPSIIGMISINEPALREVCTLAGMESVLCKPILKSVLSKTLQLIRLKTSFRQDEGLHQICKQQPEILLSSPSFSVASNPSVLAPDRRLHVSVDPFKSIPTQHTNRKRRTSSVP